MKCHRLYLIADFENFSSDTLKWLIFAVTAYDTVSVNEGLDHSCSLSYDYG